MLNIKLKLDLGELTETQAEMIQKSSIEWAIATTRNDKILIEAVVHQQSCIEGIAQLLAERNPLILGGWKQDGLPLNKEYKITRGEVEEDNIVEIVDILDEDGNPIENPYPFQETEYLELMPDIVEYGGDMEIISSVRPTEPKVLLLFGGWEASNFEV